MRFLTMLPGRAWTVEELRAKSWEDLHKLWWVCAKELNIMLTQRIERERLKPGEGAHEARRRAMQIKTHSGVLSMLSQSGIMRGRRHRPSQRPTRMWI